MKTVHAWLTEVDASQFISAIYDLFISKPSYRFLHQLSDRAPH